MNADIYIYLFKFKFKFNLTLILTDSHKILHYNIYNDVDKS